MHVAVRQADLPRERRYPVSFLRSVVLTTLKQAAPGAAVEMSLTLTGDEWVHELNREHRGIDKPTDVLSFALEDGPALVLPPGMPRQLGDVIVSLDTVERQAADEGNSARSELAWVISHGTLHLLGFDHADQAGLRAMRAQEQRVLQQLGIPRCWPDIDANSSLAGDA